MTEWEKSQQGYLYDASYDQEIVDDTVIGAGSVVNKDIPGGVVAAGNPCRVIRKITEADKQKYPVWKE